MYSEVEFDFYTSDRTRLFAKGWIHENFDIEKVIIFHHGIGEHCHRYKNLINYIEELEFSFFSYDIRGHGKSSGIRGDAESIKKLVMDIEEYIYFLKKEYKIRKPFLLGHSLGGLVTSYFSLKHSNQEEIKALILSAPALKISLNPLQYIKKITGKVINFIQPQMILKSEINPNWLSHNKKVIEEYKKDPLIHPFLSVRLGMSIFDAIEFVHHHSKKLKIPLWIGHGTEDKITSYQGSQEFYESVSSGDKTIKLFSGFYHEIFNESSKIPLEELKQWLENKITSY